MSIDEEEKDLFLGKRLNLLRDKYSITQGVFAKRLNISLRTYQHYEKGERSISKQVLYRLAKDLNVDLNWLLTGVESFSIDQHRASPGWREIDSILLENIGRELLKQIEDAGNTPLLDSIGVRTGHYSALIYNRIIKLVSHDENWEQTVVDEVSYFLSIRDIDASDMEIASDL